VAERPAGGQERLPLDMAPAPALAIRKGMARTDAEAILGPADKITTRSEGSLKVTVDTYERGDKVYTVEYVEGVLTKYAIASK
jgi:hypothetical protein